MDKDFARKMFDIGYKVPDMDYDLRSLRALSVELRMFFAFRFVQKLWHMQPDKELFFLDKPLPETPVLILEYSREDERVYSVKICPRGFIADFECRLYKGPDFLVTSSKKYIYSHTEQFAKYDITIPDEEMSVQKLVGIEMIHNLKLFICKNGSIWSVSRSSFFFPAVLVVTGDRNFCYDFKEFDARKTFPCCSRDIVLRGMFRPAIVSHSLVSNLIKRKVFCVASALARYGMDVEDKVYSSDDLIALQELLRWQIVLCSKHTDVKWALTDKKFFRSMVFICEPSFNHVEAIRLTTADVSVYPVYELKDQIAMASEIKKGFKYVEVKELFPAPADKDARTKLIKTHLSNGDGWWVLNFDNKAVALTIRKGKYLYQEFEKAQKRQMAEWFENANPIRRAVKHMSAEVPFDISYDHVNDFSALFSKITHGSGLNVAYNYSLSKKLVPKADTVARLITGLTEWYLPDLLLECFNQKKCFASVVLGCSKEEVCTNLGAAFAYDRRLLGISLRYNFFCVENLGGENFLSDREGFMISKFLNTFGEEAIFLNLDERVPENVILKDDIKFFFCTNPNLYPVMNGFLQRRKGKTQKAWDTIFCTILNNLVGCVNEIRSEPAQQHLYAFATKVQEFLNSVIIERGLSATGLKEEHRSVYGTIADAFWALSSFSAHGHVIDLMKLVEAAQVFNTVEALNGYVNTRGLRLASVSF